MSSNNEFQTKTNKKYFYQKVKSKNEVSNKIQSPNKYNYTISENSKNENKESNIYIGGIALYSNRESIVNNENNNEINYNKNKNSIYKNQDNNINNDNNIVGGINHLYSFKPKETPSSPQFSKNISDFKDDEDEMKFNNKKYYNNNKNFSETVETKIEKDIKNNNNIIKNEKLIIIDNIDNINDNDTNNYNGHNHIVSLGKLNNENKEKNSNDSQDIQKQNKEESLMKKVLEIESIKKVIEEEDNGKENVIEEEDNFQEINLLDKKQNNNFERHKFSMNKKNSNNKIISPSQTTIPKLKEAKVKEKSLKLLEDFIKSPKLNKGYKKNIDSYNNINNNKNNNLNKYDYINYEKNKEKKEERKVNQGSPIKKKLNMVYKIPIKKKTEMKNKKKLYSPNKNSIKVNNIIKINNSNINTENKTTNINLFNIFSNENNYYSKENSINQADLNKIKKKLYTNSEGKEKVIVKKKPKIIKFNSRLLITPSKPRTNGYQPEKFSFTPIVDKKSQKIWKERIRRIEENLKTQEKHSESKSNKKLKSSIYDLLYEEGIKQNKKLKEKYLSENKKIKSDSNSKKILDNSYDFAKKAMNKNIDKIIKTFQNENDEKLSFIQYAQCLIGIRIINELIKADQIKDLNLDTIKNIVKNIKKNDQKKLEELEFIEQFWFILNPTSEEYIDCNLFSKIIKILFSSDNSKIKICSDDINNLLNEYNIELKNNKSGIFISPLRDKNFELNDIWEISKLIKKFLKLKSDLMGYKNNFSEFKKELFKNKLTKEREKELLFCPNLSESNFVFTNSKFDYYKNTNDDLNKTYTNATQIRKKNFNKLYERFMEEDRLHQRVLEAMREIKNQKEQKKCTFTPKINKYKSRNSFSKIDFNKSVDYSSNYNSKKVPVYERLYNFIKIYNRKIIKSEDNEKMENKFNSKKSIKDDNSYSKIQNSKLKSKSQERKRNEFGNKYKYINDIKKINENKIYERKTKKIKNKFNNKSIKIDKNIIDNIYVIMNINLPKGGKGQIKIYKNIDNIKSLVNEFCKKNNINDENKKIIYNEAVMFKNNVFGKNINEIKFTTENIDDKQSSENMDTNTNTNE